MRDSGSQAPYFIVHKNSRLLNEKRKVSVLCHFKSCVLCMHVLASYIRVCTVRAVLYCVLRKAEQNAMLGSFFYLGMTVVLNFENGWLYDRFQMAHRLFSKSDRQTDRQTSTMTYLKSKKKIREFV
jgi:hypothetical protein